LRSGVATVACATERHLEKKKNEGKGRTGVRPVVKKIIRVGLGQKHPDSLKRSKQAAW